MMPAIGPPDQAYAFTLRGHPLRFRFPKSWYIVVLALAACHGKTDKSRQHLNDTVPFYHLPAVPAPDKAEAARIRNACQLWYDSVLRPKGFNGGILVAKKGNIIFEAYNGTTRIPGTVPITAATPLHIASTSKTFTAMAVLQLWQEGRLNIDDEFSKYFPQFNYPGVTIRSLLCHRSGLPNYTYFMENLGWDKSRFVSNQDVFDFLCNRKAEFPDIAPPNTHFSYCNTNFALLALLIEKISGLPYPVYMQQHFFTPLQMKNTHVFTLADTATAVPSYDWKGRLMPFGFLDGVYGDKNIYTTVRDLLIWDRALRSGLLFTPQTLEQAYAPYSNEKPGIRNYGLGWRMNILPDGRKVIYHNGWWHGSNSTFIRLIPEEATIIAIGNRFTRAVYHAKMLANIFGDYYSSPEEEEGDSSHNPDSLLRSRPDTAAPEKPRQKPIPGKKSKKQ